MSNPLHELRSLLNAGVAPIYMGTVLQVKDTTVIVSTRVGSIEMPIAGTGTYTQGDSVRVANNTVVGKAKEDKDLPRYYV